MMIRDNSVRGACSAIIPASPPTTLGRTCSESTNRVASVLKVEMIESSQVSIGLNAEMTDSLGVAKVLDAEMSESS